MRLATVLITLSLGAGVLGGCAAPTSGGWTKQGMTQEQLLRDTADCLNASSRMEARADGMRREVDEIRYRHCMTDRGYTTGAAQ